MCISLTACKFDIYHTMVIVQKFSTRFQKLFVRVYFKLQHIHYIPQSHIYLYSIEY